MESRLLGIIAEMLFAIDTDAEGLSGRRCVLEFAASVRLKLVGIMAICAGILGLTGS
jgi:hypothetical protein